MKPYQIVFGSAALLLAVAPANGQSQRLDDIVPAIADEGSIHLALMNNGSRDGFMHLGWTRDGSDLRVFDRTMLPSSEVYETFEAVLDASTLAPRMIDLDFFRGLSIFEIDLEFSERRVVGTRAGYNPLQGRQSADVDLELPEGFQMRAVAFILPLYLSQEIGSSVSFSWYAPLVNSTADVSITAAALENVETPNGSVQAIRYEIRGGSPDNDVFVTTEENPEIVRIDVLGRDMHFVTMAAE